MVRTKPRFLEREEYIILAVFDVFKDYLKLKRVIENNRSQKKTDEKVDEKKDKSSGLISRHAGGLCFDILKQDKTMYSIRKTENVQATRFRKFFS
jgi:hypothetical protein